MKEATRGSILTSLALLVWALSGCSPTSKCGGTEIPLLDATAPGLDAASDTQNDTLGIDSRQDLALADNAPDAAQDAAQDHQVQDISLDSPSCLPNCQSPLRECGDDGCGGSCGTCSNEQMCCGGTCSTVDAELSVFHQNEVLPASTWVDLGIGGHPGHAFNVDGNNSTCAPAGDCQEGLDNQMSKNFEKLAQDFEGFLTARTGTPEDGRILPDLLAHFWPGLVLFVPVQGSEDLCGVGGKPYIDFYEAYWGAESETCNKETDTCNMIFNPYSMDPISFKAQLRLPVTAEFPTRVQAGGPGHTLELWVVIGEEYFPLHLYGTTAVLERPAEGEPFTGGLVGGAIDQAELVAIELARMQAQPGPITDPIIPWSAFEELLDDIFVPDLDQDNDGTPDAISFGVRFTTSPAKVEGYWEEPIY